MAKARKYEFKLGRLRFTSELLHITSSFLEQCTYAMNQSQARVYFSIAAIDQLHHKLTDQSGSSPTWMDSQRPDTQATQSVCVGSVVNAACWVQRS